MADDWTINIHLCVHEKNLAINVTQRKINNHNRVMYLVSNRMVHGDTQEFLGLKNTTVKFVWSVYNSLKFRHTT